MRPHEESGHLADAARPRTLLRLVKQARAEIRDEQANPSGELGVTAQEVATASEQLPL
jgi:hypothetical protein